MATLDTRLLEWAVAATAPGADVAEIRGLRDGHSPWLLRLTRDDKEQRVILRVGTTGSRADLATEQAALRLATDRDIPVPALLDADLTGDPPLLLMEYLNGTSTIPSAAPTARLREAGRAAATLHTLTLEPTTALPRRDRPIPSVDFAALRRQHPPQPLLVQAEESLATRPAPEPDGFVHGDLWQGNLMWTGDHLIGLIDWDCAGVGPAGVDLGSMRCDAAVAFGLHAADEVTRGWTEAAGHEPRNAAYWDVVAALSTPPDMGWFPEAYAGQGRPDLTQGLLRERRDAFLRAALDHLGT